MNQDRPSRGGRRTRTVCDVCKAMERIAPLKLAQEWDNVGLIAGDAQSPVRRLLLTIDLSGPVVQEAVERRCEMVIAYHPPIFKPIRSLRASSSGMEALVFRCIRAGLSVYSPHTALDAAEGGTNDVLARLCGLTRTEPIEFVDDPRGAQCKFVVFVPAEHVEKVSDAIFTAGAGHIGDYSRCSFRIPGEGTFLGGKTTNPRVGQRGRVAAVKEIRVEAVVFVRDLPAVVAAMGGAHPYEEPAFDIYSLRGAPVRGIGRIGRFEKPKTLSALARALRTAVKVDRVQVVGDAGQRIEQAVVVAGAAGDLPFRVPLGPRHVIVTGEIRHHDALTIRRIGCAALALGHWASERPALTPLRARLHELLNVSVTVSAADADPFGG